MWAESNVTPSQAVPLCGIYSNLISLDRCGKEEQRQALASQRLMIVGIIVE